MGQIHQDAIVAVYKLLLNTVLYLGGMPKILTTSRKYYSIYNNMLRDTDDFCQWVNVFIGNKFKQNVIYIYFFIFMPSTISNFFFLGDEFFRWYSLTFFCLFKCYLIIPVNILWYVEIIHPWGSPPCGYHLAALSCRGLGMCQIKPMVSGKRRAFHV